MRILVVGAGGFIGSRVVSELLARGHSVACVGRSAANLRRRWPACQPVCGNLALDKVDDWSARLTGIDAVINAAGVLRGELETVHHRGPVALFDACAQAGVSHLIQVSALGAGGETRSQFLSTKHAADQHLRRLADERGLRGWTVLRPSLVIGRGGASTALFCSLAAMPMAIRLAMGTWRVQPIHVADLARLVATLVERADLPPVLDVVGPEPMTTDDLTDTLGAWLDLPRRRFLTLPLPLLRLGAFIGDMRPSAQLSTDALTMLAAGNTADVEPLARALGWKPRRLTDALAAEPSVRADRWLARMLPVRTVLRTSLVAVWVGSGLASFALAPDRAEILLSRVTTDSTTARAITWGGAMLDIVLGLTLLVPRWRRRVLQGQLVVMLSYTLLATIALPGLWADPFGSLLKNFAVLAATLALLAIED